VYPLPECASLRGLFAPFPSFVSSEKPSFSKRKFPKVANAGEHVCKAKRRVKSSRNKELFPKIPYRKDPNFYTRKEIKIPFLNPELELP